MLLELKTHEWLNERGEEMEIPFISSEAVSLVLYTNKDQSNYGEQSNSSLICSRES